MRVGILALLQESNSFSTQATTLEDFAADLLLTDGEIRAHFEAAHHEVGGFLASLDEQQLEAVPLFAARAVPAGPIVVAAFDELCRRLTSAVQAAGKLDGILVAAHGATVSEQVRDVDGRWLSAVRQLVGANVPIIGTLDPHANVSPQMIASCDALVAYHTNPHLDQRERGCEAAQMMARTLRGEIRPRMAAAFPPIALGINAHNTAESPCREWFELAATVADQHGILAASPILGFPYADVEEMGTSVIVVADSDAALARREADRLARWLWARRYEFDRKPISIEQALREVQQVDGTTCLLDIGDNIGAGSPADTTHLAHALSDQDAGPALVCITDPDCVERVRQVGVGTQILAEVGGKSQMSGPPLGGRFLVKSLSDGKFSESEARHGGWVEFDQGPTVVLESDRGLTLVVNSRRTPPFSLSQLTSCGLDPRKFRVLVAKGVHAPVAAYREVCERLIRVDTPGTTSADMKRFTFHHRRWPMFPFERECSWEEAER